MSSKEVNNISLGQLAWLMGRTVHRVAEIQYNRCLNSDLRGSISSLLQEKKLYSFIWANGYFIRVFASWLQSQCYFQDKSIASTIRNNQWCSHKCWGCVICWLLVRLRTQCRRLHHLFNGRVDSFLSHFTAKCVTMINPTVVWNSSRFLYYLSF